MIKIEFEWRCCICKIPFKLEQIKDGTVLEVEEHRFACSGHHGVWEEHRSHMFAKHVFEISKNPNAFLDFFKQILEKNYD